MNRPLQKSSQMRLGSRSHPRHTDEALFVNGFLLRSMATFHFPQETKLDRGTILIYSVKIHGYADLATPDQVASVG
jgi:hypothetical protein